MYINYIYICILIIYIYNIFTYKQYRKMFFKSALCDHSYNWVAIWDNIFDNKVDINEIWSTL